VCFLTLAPFLLASLLHDDDEGEIIATATSSKRVYNLFMLRFGYGTVFFVTLLLLVLSYWCFVRKDVVVYGRYGTTETEDFFL